MSQNPPEPPPPPYPSAKKGGQPRRDSKHSVKRGKNRLLVLGSAAVLAVYSAGYMRTRAAAQRFDEIDSATRRPSATTGIAPPSTSTSGVPAASAATAVPEKPATPLVPPASPLVVVTKAAPAVLPGATSSNPATSAPTAVAAAVPVVPPSAAVAAAPAPVTTVAPVGPANAMAPGAPSQAPTASPTAAASPEVTAKVAAAARPKWNDGKFSGWGSCRHGDIQATIEIKAGRIISATVTDCRTRYSCDVIDKIIPQVVARQSADVDTVSGATQSADAFYYAVTAALASAKPEAVKAP